MKYDNQNIVAGNEDKIKIEFYHEIVNSRNEMDESFVHPHKQAYYELSFFVSGRRKIMAENELYEFGAGDIFIVSPHEAHSGSAVHGMLDRYRLHIFPEAFDDMPDGDKVKQIFDSGNGNKLTLSISDMDEVRKYLFDIENSMKFGNPDTKRICAYADIIKLLVFLRNTVFSEAKQSEPKSRLLLDIMSYIELSFDTVTAAEIERQFSVSHSTLWRIFNRELNMSPSSYILDIKLEKAKLMLTGDTDIQTISDRCGFCDCSYFIKKFKEKYGMTPYKMKI